MFPAGHIVKIKMSENENDLGFPSLDIRPKKIKYPIVSGIQYFFIIHIYFTLIRHFEKTKFKNRWSAVKGGGEYILIVSSLKC